MLKKFTVSDFNLKTEWSAGRTKNIHGKHRRHDV